MVMSTSKRGHKEAVLKTISFLFDCEFIKFMSPQKVWTPEMGYHSGTKDLSLEIATKTTNDVRKIEIGLAENYQVWL